MNFLAQNAAYLSWFTGPIATDTGSKTHTISVNTDGDIEVHQLVHSTGVVTTTELEATFEVDDHAPCALYERTDGKLIAFWAEHTSGSNTALRYAISTNSDDSTAWGSASDLLTAAQGSWTYAVPIYLPDEGSGVLYVFTRDNSGATIAWNYVKSTDDGANWTGPVDFLRCSTAEDYPYPVFCGDGSDRIDIASSVVDLSDPDPEDRLDVYHAYFKAEELFDSGGTSIASNGGSPDFPATLETDFTKVYDSSTGDQAWVWDIIPNGGNPAIAYATFPDVSTNHDYYVAVHSTGTTWGSPTKVADAGGSIVDTSTSGQNHYSGGICFDGDDPDAVYCSIGDWADGSRIVRMVNDSGWSEDYTIAGTIGRRVANIRPVLPFTTGTRSRRCRLLWMHGEYNDYEDYDTDIRYLCDAVGMKAAGWTHFIPLDIATSQVTGSAEVNGHMTALITHDSLTGSNATAFWANVQNGGADIRVSVGATNTSGTEYDAIQVLPVDVYYCDTSTEKLKMRVCLPEAATGATVQIWVGNSSASARTTRAGHDSDGFPGSYATYSPRIVAMVPDFTVASGNITDRTGNGNTLTVAGSPDYQQTDQWGGPGAMYFTGSDGDMAYADASIGRCGIGWLTPELNATTENSEMWWLFHGHPSATTPYLYARLTDTSEPSDSEVGASISGGGGGTPTDSESFSGFAQHHAVMQINGGPSRAVQVNNRTEVTGVNKSATGIATFAINGLRRNSANTVRGKGVYHDLIVFSLDNGGQFLNTDAIDTYWANHNAPGDFWDEGTVVNMDPPDFQAAWAIPTVTIVSA